jgi:hypothetical protein
MAVQPSTLLRFTYSKAQGLVLSGFEPECPDLKGRVSQFPLPNVRQFTCFFRTAPTSGFALTSVPLWMENPPKSCSRRRRDHVLCAAACDWSFDAFRSANVQCP